MRSDPYAAFNFLVELGDVRVAGFSECSGLSMSTQYTTYQEGGRNGQPLIFPETAAFGTLTLKRGLSASNDLMVWQFDVAEGHFSINPRQVPGSLRRDIGIVLLNERRLPVKRWNLIRAFPVKWQGPDLKAGESSLAIEAIELAYEGIMPTPLEQS